MDTAMEAAHGEPSGMSAMEAISALQILATNHGFRDSVAWLNHPDARHFKPVGAREIPFCPDCGHVHDGELGQYLYYSTLIHLRRCSRCTLVWADQAIDPNVVRAHFERAYKDTEYFEHARAPIFEQMSRLASQRTPFNGRVLDVGGGMGHLMDRLRTRRPDIAATVLDISEQSVEYARSHFGLRALCGTIQEPIDERYDVVICSDVIYYADDILESWVTLHRITDTLILRLPDKLGSISLRQWLYRKLCPARRQALQDNVAGFNPEHRYIMGRRYLQQRLEKMGFRVRFVPAVTLAPPGFAGHLLRAASWCLRRVGYSPAMVVIATRPPLRIMPRS